jgi:hypothetical protein
MVFRRVQVRLTRFGDRLCAPARMRYQCRAREDTRLFAPKVLNSQTKACESPARNLAPQPSALVERPIGRSTVGQPRVPAGTIGNQAMLRYLAHQRSNLPADRQAAAPENITAREQPAGAGLAARATDSQRPKVLESSGAQEPDEDLRNLQPPGPGSGSSGGTSGGSAAPAASLSVSSAGYVDSAAASRKTVTFNATWSTRKPSGMSPITCQACLRSKHGGIPPTFAIPWEVRA